MRETFGLHASVHLWNADTDRSVSDAEHGRYHFVPSNLGPDAQRDDGRHLVDEASRSAAACSPAASSDTPRFHGEVLTLHQQAAKDHATAAFHLDPATSSPDHGLLLWTWSYGGDGISASGTFTTTGTADADGFYLITDISGMRNGEAIVALQAAGTAIPGNEPFVVDNLISPTEPQLTGNGFGYVIEDGTFANPFFADFLAPPSYLEFFSAPPFGPTLGSEDSELPVSFAACVAPWFDMADVDAKAAWQWLA